MINTTNDPSTPPTQRSIGELVQSIRDELLGVVHHEIDIAKKEITALGIKVGIIAAMAAVLLFLLLSAWVMLLFAAATGLQALGLPAWGSFRLVSRRCSHSHNRASRQGALSQSPRPGATQHARQQLTRSV